MSVVPGVEYGFKAIMKEVVRHRAGLIALIIILILIGTSIYTIIKIPYGKAQEYWSRPELWIKNPRNALPIWWEFFTGKKLPRSIILRSDAPYAKVVKLNETCLKIVIPFKYEYDDFPSEITIFFNASYKSTPPTVVLDWIKPSGEKIHVLKYTLTRPDDYLYVSNMFKLAAKLEREIIFKLGGSPEYSITIERALFLDYKSLKKPIPEKGIYKIVYYIRLGSPEDKIKIETILYGKVYGWAGTDHLRRPLSIALLWGTPIALAFGLSASLAITLFQLFIAVISGWFGGTVDSLIQRVTEVYMILPFLPTLIMIAILYKLNLWVILIVVILLSLFGPSVKVYRAMVMQLKNSAYVEAALAYGASSMRIISLYIFPRLLPLAIPSIILSIPNFVFLEAALAFLGLGDPRLPTWGKVLDDAYHNGALYKGYYYWVIEPSIMLIITALAFAFLGMVLEKIVNPKLREM